MTTEPWKIVGQGLAGTCLAWALWERGEPFQVIDRENGGSSRVAAGMINPITGKNFSPSWQLATFLPEAIAFYRRAEAVLGCRFWHPLPVLRLARGESEWRKIVSKLAQPDVSPWIAGELAAPSGWVGAVEVCGGGRLDTRAFLDRSREMFRRAGCYAFGEIPTGGIRCDGAAGLLLGDYGPHRCAKGEILTLRADGWDKSHIRVGAGGWLVPLGGGHFKAGSTYEWNDLDEIPTTAGRVQVEEIASQLGGDAYEIVAHDAGIRPILRRSEPLIGPVASGAWMFNALGSKGSLYAPGTAARLADWLVNDIEPDPALDYRAFREKSKQL